MIKITTPRGVYTARIYSNELWPINTHWSAARNRTIICPRLGCDACKVERPKIRAYAIGRCKGVNDETPGLLELPAGLLDQLHRFGLKDHDDAYGWTWTAEPTATYGHKVRGANRIELPNATRWSNVELSAAIETLYQLPAAMTIDEHGAHHSSNIDDWLQLHQQAFTRRAADAFSARKETLV